MPDIDWGALSLETLKQMQKDVTKAIESFEMRKRQDALAAVEAKAAEMGFTLKDLVGPAKLNAIKSTPKYRKLDDPSKTWTGRGRQPNWVKDTLADGKTLNDLLISKR
ncbi:H-NS histone family protein [Rhodophyticola sp. CCM32]|uniref:H-NS histone family protein n=1 Tax=Rhodophyticola sp. CCM32 TaxID=2916397 RepID=UPI00107F7CDA|nr:H-NS histone family protein [Rhodophyticola sp. CCM32]QBY00360.1 H-NS histone family protein [Rhodophyticola sp. CCM32]